MRNRDIDTNCREDAIMAVYPDATCKHLEGIWLDKKIGLSHKKVIDTFLK